MTTYPCPHCGNVPECHAHVVSGKMEKIEARAGDGGVCIVCQQLLVVAEISPGVLGHVKMSTEYYDAMKETPALAALRKVTLAALLVKHGRHLAGVAIQVDDDNCVVVTPMLTEKPVPKNYGWPSPNRRRRRTDPSNN